MSPETELKTEVNFEQSLKELEVLVEKMRKGDLPLDESLKMFERGVSLVRVCQTQLDQADKKVEQLMLRADGTVERKPFENS